MIESLSTLDSYNIVWDKPGLSDRDSMPLGNGEVGISLWAEEDGDLQFYIGRSDSQTELDRNVKLGKVRVSILSNPFASGNPFKQELKLREGCCYLTAGPEGNKVRLRIFVDAGNPTIYIVGELDQPSKVCSSFYSWRTDRRAPGSDCPLGENPPKPIYESADCVEDHQDGVLFYHRNGLTCIPILADLQGLQDHLNVIPDTLTDRVFGGFLSMEGSKAAGKGIRESLTEVTSFVVKITTSSEQVKQTDDWVVALLESHKKSPEHNVAFHRTAKNWEEYWQGSWMFVEGDQRVEPKIDPSVLSLVHVSNDSMNRKVPSTVTQSYILTKWMFACTSRGNFPIRYNGSLFNLMPGANEHYSVERFGSTFTAPPVGEPNMDFNPDERSWNHDNLWQNIRLPYHTFLAQGDPGPMKVLFRFYQRFLALNRTRAKLYHNAEGQHSTEIALTFGLMPGHVYGYDRTDKPLGYAENRWGGAVDVSPGLELAHMMLDYFLYTRDEIFLTEELVPYARQLLRYIETRFKKREDGKISIAPLQSVETYWDTTDPIPVVAGMHVIIDGLLTELGQDNPEREFFESMKALTPDMPKQLLGEGEVLAPARSYEDIRKNVESPEFYGIFPFKYYGLGKEDLDFAISSYYHVLKKSEGFRPFTIGEKPSYTSFSGWQQQGMVAAMLGLADESRTILEANCQLTNPGVRFPAMWGPIYDSVPDIDHGANIINTMQLMAFQVEGNRIRILPSWPRDWNVSFKLHAPGNTIVECIYRDGKIVKLETIPPERMKDIICNL